MYSITDLFNNPFYNGLTVGVLTAMAFTVTKKLICKNSSSHGCKSSVKSFSQISSVKASGEFKMALLVRHDLKMGKGKVAAQCSHATVHCYEEGLRLKPGEINSWEANNKPMDIFKIDNEETMLNYQKLAIKEGFTTYIVVDAGRTQVAPRSKTVMAIGPARKEHIDIFTQNLQCAVVSVITYNKTKLCGLPSKCARVVLRVSDLKSMECIQKQCKLFDIPTAAFTENGQVTVLAIGPANEESINAQVHHLKLY